MRVRLNGWQRIGIILSVIWVPIGFFWSASDVDNQVSRVWDPMVRAASDLNDSTLNGCISRIRTSIPKMNLWAAAEEPCWNEWHARDGADTKKNVAFAMDLQASMRPEIWFVTFATIPIAWLIVYALIGLWRWISRGFNT
jgi:hypothetical protein